MVCGENPEDGFSHNKAQIICSHIFSSPSLD